VFVTRIDSGGDIASSILIGGSQNDTASGIAVNQLGQVCISGYTTSVDLPVTQSAAQPVRGSLVDAFVMILNFVK
jgi:hypothetical protein